MTEPSESTGESRRTVLRTGAAAVGTALLGGSMLGVPSGARGPTRGALASAVASHGHYARFPFGQSTWKRSTNPYDAENGESRWLAEPSGGGGVRCLAEGVPDGRNVGFDVHVGALGEIASVTVDARTLATAAGAHADYLLGVYLDVDGDGDFFDWADGRGNTDVWAGFGDDAEGVVSAPADGSFTVDDDTELALVHAGSGPDVATLEELQAGTVTGVDGTPVDGGTDAAVYVGVLGSGAGREEIVVDSVDVRRS